MADRRSVAFLTSLALHGAVVAIMLVVAYAGRMDSAREPATFELVDGEGDNFGATVAPALGSSGGIKVPAEAMPPVVPPKIDLTPPETVKPVAPAPVAAPAPVPVATPTEKTPDAKATAPTKERTLAEQFRRKAIVAESKVKMQVLREKAAEAKRLEKERQEEERRAKAAAALRVDAEGIAKGVKGGSTANKEGGAGGKALSRSDGPVMDAYFALLRDRLVKALDKPPGVSDTLVAEVEFQLGADGSLSAAKIIGPSGSADFDRAVLDAFSRVHLPKRPDGNTSVHSLKFRTKDLEN